jgi:hypothetical protein
MKYLLLGVATMAYSSFVLDARGPAVAETISPGVELVLPARTFQP